MKCFFRLSLQLSRRLNVDVSLPLLDSLQFGYVASERKRDVLSGSTMPDWILLSLHWAMSSLGSMMTSFSTMGKKDFATLTVSLIALIVSVTSVRHSIVSKKGDTERSARSEFAEIVEAMVDLRQKREDIRRELGADWAANKHFITRVNLNDKRELLISRAAYLLHNFVINVSSIQYTIIGAMVSDAGRPAESLQYFSKALDVSSTPLARTSAARNYGRVLMLAGEIGRGRAEMLSAADGYACLEAEPGLDADMMRYNRADVFRRLAWVGIDLGTQAHLKDDYDKLVAFTALIRNRGNRQQLDDAIQELDKVFIERGITKSESVAAQVK